MTQNNLDKTFDVPDFTPENQLPLQKVGTTGRIFPITLKLPNSPKFTSTCTVDIFVQLSPHQRGVHVSRISEAIQSIYKDEFESPQQLAHKLALLVFEGQPSVASFVDLKFTWTEIEKTPVTSLDSLQSYEILATAKVSKEKPYLGIAATVPGITACPCVQINALEYYRERNLGNKLPVDFDEKIPLFSHSQRVLIKVCLSLADPSIAQSLDFRDLIETVKETVPQTYDLLKRIDEVKVVEKAHLNPLFCEDVARNLGVNITKRFLGILSEDARLSINVSSIESIHSYNLNSELSMNIGEIIKIIKST